MRVPTTILACCLACGAVACPPGGTGGATHAEPESGDVTDAPLAVEYQAVKIVGGRETAFAQGDTLKSGALFAYYVTPNQKAHVYVLQFFPDGSRQVLKEQEIAAGERTRVPEPGADFELDEHTGEENLYIIASRLPLEEASANLKKVVQEVKTSPIRSTATDKPASGEQEEAAKEGTDEGEIRSSAEGSETETRCGRDDPACAEAGEGLDAEVGGDGHGAVADEGHEPGVGVGEGNAPVADEGHDPGVSDEAVPSTPKPLPPRASDPQMAVLADYGTKGVRVKKRGVTVKKHSYRAEAPGGDTVVIHFQFQHE